MVQLVKAERDRFVSNKIRRVRAEGKPQKQAVAIALSEARRKFDGEMYRGAHIPDHIARRRRAEAQRAIRERDSTENLVYVPSTPDQIAYVREKRDTGPAVRKTRVDYGTQLRTRDKYNQFTAR